MCLIPFAQKNKHIYLSYSVQKQEKRGKSGRQEGSANRTGRTLERVLFILCATRNPVAFGFYPYILVKDNRLETALLCLHFDAQRDFEPKYTDD